MSRKRILVVDDDATARSAYAAFLLDCGYEVVEAAHGGEAILHIHRHQPDVVLMDVAMPVLDGVQVAESLRACAPTADTRILAVTGCASGIDRERMRALCDGFLSKPCDPEVVASRIRDLVDAA